MRVPLFNNGLEIGTVEISPAETPGIITMNYREVARLELVPILVDRELIGFSLQALDIHRVGALRLDACQQVAALAHRACCGTEHDPANGKLHGYCVVCGVPWPCDTASRFL